MNIICYDGFHIFIDILKYNDILVVPTQNLKNCLYDGA